jgi:hypothetical protein
MNQFLQLSMHGRIYCLSDRKCTRESAGGLCSLLSMSLGEQTGLNVLIDQLWFSSKLAIVHGNRVDIPVPNWCLVHSLSEESVSGQSPHCPLFGSVSERRRLFAKGIVQYHRVTEGVFCFLDSSGTLYLSDVVTENQVILETRCLDIQFHSVASGTISGS